MRNAWMPRRANSAHAHLQRIARPSRFTPRASLLARLVDAQLVERVAVRGRHPLQGAAEREAHRAAALGGARHGLADEGAAVEGLAPGEGEALAGAPGQP